MEIACLTVRQVAERLNVNHKTVRKLIQRGQLAAVKIGGAVRIPEEGLQAYLADHATKKPESSTVKVTPACRQTKRIKPARRDWFS